MKPFRLSWLAACGVLAALAAWGAGSLQFALKDTFGETGPGRTELEEPVDVALGRGGDVAALDGKRGALVLFSSTGRWLKTVGDRTAGPSAEQLREPRGLAVDGRGRYWVADSGNHRVVLFGGDGRFLEVIGSLGAQPGRFRHPADVAFDRRGRVYVADLGNDRVQVFRPDGSLLTSWERRSRNRRDHLAKPVSLAYSDWGKGALWVVNEGSAMLEKFDLEEGEWVESLDVADKVSGAVRIERIEIEPTFHRMFLADSAGKRVLVVSRRGELEAEIRADERGSIVPMGLAVTRELDVFVADAGGPRVAWFRRE